MKRNNNKTVVDLKKVQYADYYYRNQYGNVSSVAHKHSVRGFPYNPEAMAFPFYPGNLEETMEQRAVRYEIKDIWTPELRLQMGSNHSLVYTGAKATSLWEAWKAKQFGNGKKD